MDHLTFLPGAWRLRFPRQTEQEFISHYYVRTIGTVKASLAAGLVVIAAFGLLDAYSVPLATRAAWFYRFAVGCPALLGAFLLAFRPSLRAYLQLAMSAAVGLAGLAVILIIRASQPVEPAYDHYYVGLLIIMLFSGSWIRLRFWHALAVNTLLLVVYGVLIAYPRYANNEWLLVLNSGVFLLAAHLVATLTCYFFEVASRIDFLQQRTIETEKNKSNTQRAKLEAQATQLTAALASLRATQAQLVQQEKMASLGALTAGIAHEIQNPLNFVTNFSDVSAELVAELREERAKGDAADAAVTDEILEDLTQNLGKIGHHGRRAADIVKGMLQHSQTSAGEGQPTDLNRLCDEYLRLAYHELRAKDKSFNAELTTDFMAGLPPVTVVSADVGRVLLNLFTNAFYAVRQRQQTGEVDYQPQVGIRTLMLNQRVQVLVTDNGTGINPAVQNKIFQPFFTTKPPGEGTGLGLSLAHDIIAQGHGGTLSVESQEGEGTTFSVSLPVNAPG